MSDRVAVAKMHGARNDFVIVDTREQALDDVVEFARAVCRRTTGIGADGLLVIGSGAAGPSMRVINADGSEAEMCGNGVRCVARYLDECGDGADQIIETKAGPIATSVLVRGPVYRVRVDMGRAHVVDMPLPWPQAVAVDVGNPHLVMFVASLDDVDLADLGERLQHDALFPNGVNVHLAVVRDEHTLDARHYERGVGLTMACGTGAVACAKAAIARGVAHSPVTVRVPGGELQIEFTPTGSALMTGPAERVFDTTIAP